MMSLVLILLTLVGHVLLGAVVFNQLHSRRLLVFWLCKLLTLLELAFMVLTPPALAYWFHATGADLFGDGDWFHLLPWPAQGYVGLCVAAAVLGGPWWAWGRWRGHHRVPIRSHSAQLVNLDRSADKASTSNDEHHFLTRLPGNQTLLLDVVERGGELERLAPALEGLSVVHLSDFHLSGRVGKGYFEEVVRLSNQLEPDLVAITGDVVDRTECLDWVPELFGKLTCRVGAYFVLGNHDMRVDVERLRGSLVDSGLVDLGGRWIEREIRGQRVLLAGNESPWGHPAPDLQHAPPPRALPKGQARLRRTKAGRIPRAWIHRS